VTILTIRKHKRFAVRRKASLRCADAPSKTALLIELSLDGCRLGLTGNWTYSIGDFVTLSVTGFESRQAQVRWSGQGYVGLRFANPLHVAELDALVRACRPEPLYEPQLRAAAG